MLILLDIDGVMVRASNWKPPELLNDNFPDFSAKAVFSLNKIIRETGSSILLTTSHKALYSIKEWETIFLRRGINAVISCLPEAGINQSRKDEIINWFQHYQSSENFIIIDDDKSLNDLPTFLKNKLILTSPLIGLTDELAEKAIKILRMLELTSFH